MMSKKEVYNEELSKIIFNDNIKQLENYLLENSNLPSPRANLELAEAFSIFFDKKNNKLLEQIYLWANTPEDILSDNSKEIFLIFCALQALGHILVWEDNKKEIFLIFEKKMNSKLWRIRESCVIGLQDYGEKEPEKLNNYLNELYQRSSFYQKRAIFAILAHPQILKYDYIVDTSLEFTEEIFEEILIIPEISLKTEEGKTLLKSLEYVVSVFIAFGSIKGFKTLEIYARKNNKILNKIIKSNIEKNRLKKWPEKISYIKELLA